MIKSYPKLNLVFHFTSYFQGEQAFADVEATENYKLELARIIKIKEVIHLIKFLTPMRRHYIGKNYHLGPSFRKIKGVLRGLNLQKNVSPFMCAAIHQGA
ncbi:hypothetical protein TNCT_39661 [Trichonephila clavata]|uniref:Uncharacterized protein n=1 Tax=Trichonephila clavata TaxID=2740835 RepID=A0A8X6IIW8_TRICU|nr:hypothetical protein TNCT_39661 [Trichonephila clavata]